MNRRKGGNSPHSASSDHRVGAVRQFWTQSISLLHGREHDTGAEHGPETLKKRPNDEDLRRMRRITRRAALARANGLFSDWNVDTDLCDICTLLVYLVLSSFFRHDDGKPEWPKVDSDILLESPSGKIFWHHGLAHFREHPGHGCPLCRLFADALWDSMAQDVGHVWNEEAPLEIEIYTWYPPVSSPTFKAGFPHVKTTDRLEFTFSDTPRGNSLSAKSMRIVSELLSTCMRTHTSCASKDKPLPTRTIDVGLDKDVTTPRLVSTEGQIGSYIALSHCWGKSVNYVLTQERVSAFKRGIELQRLTRTFTHAVHIARELGIRWLWIDALCIIQDSDHDWHREALRMAKVYENAVMVLSAASGPDSSSGMEFKRSAKALTSMVQTPCRSVGRFIQQTFNLFSSVSEPIDSRAWTLQEHIMATAVFRVSRKLHSWKCYQEEWIEEGGVGHVRLPMHMAILPKFSTAERFIDHWHEVVMEYSKRKLTFSEDKLPALSGIASTFEARAASSGFENRTYLVGMWRESLARDLLWASIPSQTIDFGCSPSWSWTIMDKPVDYCGTQVYAASCCQIYHNHTLVDDESKAARKVQGKLVIKGTAGHIGENLKDDGSVGKMMSQQLGLDSPLPLTVWLDRTPRSPMWYIRLAEGNHSTEPTPVHWLLLLEEFQMGEGTKNNTFRRVGLCKARVDRRREDNHDSLTTRNSPGRLIDRV